jgi:hypothetical protein
MAVRLSCLLIGAAALIGAGAGSVGPYQDTVAFHHAQVCSGGVPTPPQSAHGCVARETGSVTGRHTHIESVNDGSGGSSTLTHYLLDLRRASGTTQSLEVGSSLYAAAAVGDRADLQTWRGSVVRMTVADWIQTYDPAQEGVLDYTAMGAWTGLGLILWALLGNGALRQLLGICGLRAFGWLNSGGWTIPCAHYLMNGGRSWGDYAVATVAWLLVLAIGVFAVWWGWDEWPGEPSLVRRARDRRGRRLALRRPQRDVPQT